MAYEFNHYYELQNVATGKYVNVLGNHEDGTVKNGETVNLFNRTNNPDQRWALENYGGMAMSESFCSVVKAGTR